MDALISGPIVVDYAIADILKTHWQTKIDAIITDLGLTAGFIVAPNTTHDYAIGRIYQRSSSPSVCIFRDSTVPENPSQMRQIGAPLQMVSIVRVRIRWSPAIRQNAYVGMSIYASAAREVIMQRWRAYTENHPTIKARFVNLDESTEEAASSQYAIRQIEGLTDYGSGAESNDETCDVMFKVVHKVSHPVSYT